MWHWQKIIFASFQGILDVKDLTIQCAKGYLQMSPDVFGFLKMMWPEAMLIVWVLTVEAAFAAVVTWCVTHCCIACTLNSEFIWSCGASLNCCKSSQVLVSVLLLYTSSNSYEVLCMCLTYLWTLRQDVNRFSQVIVMSPMSGVGCLWVVGTLCEQPSLHLSLIHIWRCRRIERCRSRWSPYH